MSDAGTKSELFLSKHDTSSFGKPASQEKENTKKKKKVGNWMKQNEQSTSYLQDATGWLDEAKGG